MEPTGSENISSAAELSVGAAAETGINEAGRGYAAPALLSLAAIGREIGPFPALQSQIGNGCGDCRG